MATFMRNQSFLEFMRDIYNNPNLKQDYINGDFSTIDKSSLNDEEKSFLRMVNWKNFEVEPTVQKAAFDDALAGPCETKWDGNRFERKCW